MTVRALLFDLWGTLLYVDDPASIAERRRESFVASVAEALSKIGHGHFEENVGSAVDAVVSEMVALHEEGRDLSMPERLGRLLELIEPGLRSQVTPHAMAAFEAGVVWAVRQNPPFAAPGAQAALRGAHERGLGIGLVSITGMTPGYVLRQILDELELLQHLDAMTFSDEARLAKPAEAVYRCTLEVLGVEAHEAVFIGDSPGPDIAAPQKLGMTAVQVGSRQEDGVTPDAQLDSLEELFPMLGRLGLVD
ncbi:MAG: HAD family hydrolase [Chloroflexi bacterium]|nr:HAD family hydrolase [Chloroflexota bacterium]